MSYFELPHVTDQRHINNQVAGITPRPKMITCRWCDKLKSEGQFFNRKKILSYTICAPCRGVNA